MSPFVSNKHTSIEFKLIAIRNFVEKISATDIGKEGDIISMKIELEASEPQLKSNKQCMNMNVI